MAWRPDIMESSKYGAALLGVKMQSCYPPVNSRILLDSCKDNRNQKSYHHHCPQSSPEPKD
eukprot:5412322-Amphidinium_carterae.1